MAVAADAAAVAAVAWVAASAAAWGAEVCATAAAQAVAVACAAAARAADSAAVPVEWVAADSGAVADSEAVADSVARAAVSGAVVGPVLVAFPLAVCLEWGVAEQAKAIEGPPLVQAAQIDSDRARLAEVTLGEAAVRHRIASQILAPDS